MRVETASLSFSPFVEHRFGVGTEGTAGESDLAGGPGEPSDQTGHRDAVHVDQ